MNNIHPNHWLIKTIEAIAALSFGFGIGAGIMEHQTWIGIACFVIAGTSWLFVNIIKEDNDDTEEE